MRAWERASGLAAGRWPCSRWRCWVWWRPGCGPFLAAAVADAADAAELGAAVASIQTASQVGGAVGAGVAGTLVVGAAAPGPFVAAFLAVAAAAVSVPAGPPGRQRPA
jgi:hypothetical protein